MTDPHLTVAVYLTAGIFLAIAIGLLLRSWQRTESETNRKARHDIERLAAMMDALPEPTTKIPATTRKVTK